MNHLLKCFGLVCNDIFTEHRDAIMEYLTWGPIAILIAALVPVNLIAMDHFVGPLLMTPAGEANWPLALALMTIMVLIEVAVGWFSVLLFKKCREVRA